MPVVATVKTDWFRVINDITRAGIPLQEIARELDVSKSAIIGWKQGAAPSQHHGTRNAPSNSGWKNSTWW
ncbi:hypothetical protein [Sodalis sp.]|uniref:hypothetical protein n=1 Tax=Sodalis sp. (in: enterobacteria) TaxID=1898979 RepID=UPI0038733A2D